MADRILTAMDLRLHVETVPLWADIDEMIDQASRGTLGERITTWPIDFEALVTRLDGIPYLLDGLTAAAVQGAPVRVEEFEIAVPRDDEVLDRLTFLLEDFVARRGEGFEYLDPRERGSDYWTCIAGRIRIRLIERFEPLLWVDIDPLPPSVGQLFSIRRLPLPPPLTKAHLPVVPLDDIRASDSQARRIIERIEARRGGLAEGQMSGVVEGTQHGRSIRVPVDLAQRGHVEVHPVQRHRRCLQRQRDQRLDRCHMADDQHSPRLIPGEHPVQRGAHPLPHRHEALSRGRRDRRIGQPGGHLVRPAIPDLRERQPFPGPEVRLPEPLVNHNGSTDR
jgi:hypothetical protein